MKIVRPITINTADLTSNVTEADYAAYNPATAYADGDRVIYVTPSGTATMTIANPCVVTWAAHALADDTPIVFTTTGALPTGLTAGRRYWVRDRTANTFRVAATKGGTALATSGTQSGTHTVTAQVHAVYEALQATTGNAPLISPTYWIKVSDTNRWKMLDQSNTSQTANADSIDVDIVADGRVDSAVLIGLSGASVRIVQNDATDGDVYDETHSMVASTGTSGWYSWLFDPIERVTELAVTDLLGAYTNSTFSVTVTDTGNTVLLGNLILGFAKRIGGTLYGSSAGIQDYSTKDTDDFGNTSITERDYANRGNYTVIVENDYVDRLKALLASYRATPVAYIGADDDDGSVRRASINYGIYKDFQVEFRYTSKSICTLDILSLT